MTDQSLVSWDLACGDEIQPGLTATKLLGGGSAYEVYLAFDQKLYAPVVVKLVRPDQVDDVSTLRGLEREIDLLQMLNHPAIVRGFRASTAPPRPYVMLENLDGPRLSSLIRRHGPLPLQQLLPLGIELASAVHYLGEMGVVHLDIKPSNIIMGAPARLIDLSVARPIEQAETLTKPIGTDAYMAPEQCMPAQEHRPGYASDMWGIGATLFHALAGYRPFEPWSQDDDASDKERWPQLFDEPMLLPAGVPDELARPIVACLEPDPHRRPTPSELAESFEPLMRALPRPRLGGWKPTLTK